MATVDAIIADQASRAAEYGSSADSKLSAAITAAQSVTWADTTTIVWSPTDSTYDLTTTDQAIYARYTSPGSAPSSPTNIQAIDDVDSLALPTPYLIDTTGLFEQATPTIDIESFAAAAPVVDFATIDLLLSSVAVPDITTIDPPLLHDISIALPPTVTVPTFDASLVANDPGELTGVKEAFVLEYERVLPEMQAFIDAGVAKWESEYAPGFSTGLAALEAKLQDGIDRGTALSQSFETALYTRARSRTELEYTRAAKELENGLRKRGFDIPPAALSSGLAGAQIEAANANSRQATEIAIERAKMEVQHIQFVLTTSASVRQSMTQAFMQYAGVLAQTNQQANEHAKVAADIMVQVYNAMVTRFTAQLEVYKTEAALYETRLKASLAQLDIYKLQIESAKLTVDVDALRVDMYAKEIQAELSRIEMYTSILKSIAVRAEVEKTKVDVFQAEVNAYNTQMTVEELKTKIYVASLQGDEAKLKAELAKLEAYSKTVDAEVNRVKGDVAIQGLRVESNKLILEEYKADLAKYEVEIKAALSSFEGELKGDMATIEAYKTNKLLEMDNIKTKLQRDTLTLQKATDQAKIESTTAITNAELIMKQHSILAQVSKDVGSAYGSMASAAMASQNTMVSQATTV